MGPHRGQELKPQHVYVVRLEYDREAAPLLGVFRTQKAAERAVGDWIGPNSFGHEFTRDTRPQRAPMVACWEDGFRRVTVCKVELDKMGDD